MPGLDQTRDELIELLAEAYALGRMSSAAYERFASAVARAATFEQLMRLTTIIHNKLYIESTPPGAASPPRELRSAPPTAAIVAPANATPANATPAALAADFYRALSWQAGHAPSYEALEQLVDPDARFINGGDVMTAHEFWTQRMELWLRRTIVPFIQREVAERTTVFGNIAHRLSTYEAVLAGGKLAGQGLNSIQFHRSDGWRIVSVAWDELQDGNSLPIL